MADTNTGDLTGLSGAVDAIDSAISGDPKGVIQGLAEILAGRAKAAKKGWDALTDRFASKDKHVNDVAIAIEEAFPDHVVGVNVTVGKVDIDILTKNAAIQVKSGRGKGLTEQMDRIETATGIPTIGYGPDLGKHVLGNNASTKDLQTLIDVIKL